MLSFAALEDYYQEQGRDWELTRWSRRGLWAIAKASMLTSACDAAPVCFPSLHRFQRDSVLRNMKGMIAREVRRRGLTDISNSAQAAFAKLNLSFRCSSHSRWARTVAAVALFTANAQRIAALHLLSENDAEQLRVAYRSCGVWKTCCKALTTNKPRRSF